MTPATTPAARTILPEARRGVLRRKPAPSHRAPSAAASVDEVEFLRQELATLRLAAVATPAEVQELRQELAVAREAGRRARVQAQKLAEAAEQTQADYAKQIEAL